VADHYDHQPVLLDESLELLNLRPGAVVVDGTTGGGGHAAAILQHTQPNGVLIGLDLDANALQAAGERLESFGDRVHLVRASFSNLTNVLRELGAERVDGVLLDLGVSSHQLDTRERGFRFGEAERSPAPLDMRMDQSQGRTAAQLIQRASVDQLQRWFQDYGELPGSRRLARRIAAAREEAPIETTADLVRVVREARIGAGRGHNPATLVFQALRIAVNDELEALRQGLGAAVDALRPGGRLVVIAYHSLEDRIVKRHFRAAARGCTCPPRVPVCVCGGKVTLRPINRKPIRPTDSERSANPRARSALLRAAERVEEAA